MQTTRRQAFERLYPNLTAIAAWLMAWRVWPIDSISRELHDEFNSILTVATIAVGFLGVVMSILLTIDNKWIIRRARESGAYSQLAEYIIQATRSAFFLAVFSTIGTAAKTTDHHAWYGFAVSVFWGWCVLTALQVFRLFVILGTILRAVADPE